MSLSLRRRPALLATGLLIGAFAFTACGGSDADDATGADSDTSAETTTGTEGDAESTGEWPRTFENADGTTTEIPEQPQTILSTTVSTTGTLLAIDAPVAASAAGGDGNFFDQWADVAEERDVENVWPATEVDVEAAYGVEPDLIVVSTSGADSALDQLSEFQAIAPTIVVDYGGQDWQDLATELGEALGLEDQAAETVEEFDAYVADAAEQITVPEGEANIISYNGAGEDNPIARAGGSHGQLLSALGFTVEDPNTEWHNQDNLREDFVWAPFEKLTELTAETTFILTQDNEGAQGFAEDPVLANVPSVQAEQVYGLGENSFRIDYFSATEIVDGVVENFGS
ncbi:MAG: Fe2+-enterobactin ABC transporter substrate-binding protein [Micrococcaceae bacterium]